MAGERTIFAVPTFFSGFFGYGTIVAFISGLMF
jgi:hypothetical protein